MIKRKNPKETTLALMVAILIANKLSKSVSMEGFKGIGFRFIHDMLEKSTERVFQDHFRIPKVSRNIYFVSVSITICAI